MTHVWKLGGSHLEALDEMLDVVLANLKDGTVLVHGGGPLISSTLEAFGHQAEFVEGLRVTDETTLEVVEMVLAGRVNKQIVARLLQRGVNAVGLSGIDGQMATAKVLGGGALGRVGQVERIDATTLNALIGAGSLPVVAPLAFHPELGSMNVNGDSFASALAGSLQSESLTLMTNVAGLMDASGATLPTVTPSLVERMVQSGVVYGGMIPKIEAALAAIQNGVQQVCIRSTGTHGGTILREKTHV